MKKLFNIIGGICLWITMICWNIILIWAFLYGIVLELGHEDTPPYLFFSTSGILN